MELEEYRRRAQRAADLVERGEHDQALEILKELVESDVSEIDKAVMCVNVATIYDRMGDVDGALTWFDRGIKLEERHDRFWAAEKKAAYLAELGRLQESLNIYLNLFPRPYLTEVDKFRIESNIARLRERIGE